MAARAAAGIETAATRRASDWRRVGLDFMDSSDPVSCDHRWIA
jgi:hypothetical protein